MLMSCAGRLEDTSRPSKRTKIEGANWTEQGIM